MTKLTYLLKEVSELKDIVIENYQKLESFRQQNERLRELNAKLSKQVKELKKENMTLLDEKNKQKEKEK